MGDMDGAGGEGGARELKGREGGACGETGGRFPHPACQVGSLLASPWTDQISGTHEQLRVATGLGSETARVHLLEVS